MDARLRYRLKMHFVPLIWLCLAAWKITSAHPGQSSEVIYAFNRSWIPFFIPGDFHWAGDTENLFMCSDEPNSTFQKDKKNGADIYYCQPKLYWYRYHERNDPGIFLAGEHGEPVARRAEPNVLFELLVWGQEYWWTGQLENVGHALGPEQFEILQKQKLVRQESSRFVNGQAESVETEIHYIVLAFPFVAFLMAFIMLIPMLYLGYVIIMFFWFLNYLRGFLITYPLRKFIRIIFVMGATAYYKRMWLMAEDWFIWTKTHWRMWYIIRNHRDERNPYWLEYRKPPNIINYAATFLNPADYDKHDMEMAEIEFVQEMLRWKDESPAAVALNLKIELGPKYEQYFGDDFENILLWDAEKERLRLQAEESPSEESDDEETKEKKRKAALRAKERKKMQERAKRFAKNKDNADDEFFRIEKEKRRQQSSPPPPNPYKEDPLQPWNSAEKKKLIDRAKAELSKYKNIPWSGIPKNEILPTAKALEREEKLGTALIPLLNVMSWPHHMDYLVDGKKLTDLPVDDDEDENAHDADFDDAPTLGEIEAERRKHERMKKHMAEKKRKSLEAARKKEEEETKKKEEEAKGQKATGTAETAEVKVQDGEKPEEAGRKSGPSGTKSSGQSEPEEELGWIRRPSVRFASASKESKKKSKESADDKL